MLTLILFTIICMFNSESTKLSVNSRSSFDEKLEHQRHYYVTARPIINIIVFFNIAYIMWQCARASSRLRAWWRKPGPATLGGGVSWCAGGGRRATPPRSGSSSSSGGAVVQVKKMESRGGACWGSSQWACSISSSGCMLGCVHAGLFTSILTFMVDGVHIDVCNIIVYYVHECVRV